MQLRLGLHRVNAVEWNQLYLLRGCVLHAGAEPQIGAVVTDARALSVCAVVEHAAAQAQ